MKDLKDVASLISKNIDHVQANDIFNQYINAQKVKESVIPDEIKQTSEDFHASTAEKNKIESDLGKTDGIEDVVKNNVGAKEEVMQYLGPKAREKVEKSVPLRTLISDEDFTTFIKNIAHLTDEEQVKKISALNNVLDPFGLKRMNDFIQSTGIKERINLFKKYEQSILKQIKDKLTKEEHAELIKNAVSAFDSYEFDGSLYTSLVFNLMLPEVEAKVYLKQLKEALINNNEKLLNSLQEKAFNLSKKYFGLAAEKYKNVFGDFIVALDNAADSLRNKTGLKTGIVGSTPEEISKSTKDKLVRETLQTNDELQKANEVVLKADELNAMLKSELGIDKDEFSKMVLEEEEKAKKVTINSIRRRGPQSVELIRRISEESVNLNDVFNESFIKNLAESVKKEMPKAKSEKSTQEIIRDKLRNKLSGLLQKQAKELSRNISLEQPIKSTGKGSEAENITLADTLLKKEITPETKLIEKETSIEESNILDKIKSVLSEQEFNILQYVEEGKTIQEISRLTGISREDILKSINQATDKLQKIGIKGVNIKIK